MRIFFNLLVHFIYRLFDGRLLKLREAILIAGTQLKSPDITFFMHEAFFIVPKMFSPVRKKEKIR